MSDFETRLLLPAIEDAELPPEIGMGTYTTLLDRFVETDWGQHLGEQPLRYSVNYPCGDTEADRITRWSDLGAHAHPVEHNRAAYYDVQLLLALAEQSDQATGISPADVTALRLAKITHDLGEVTHPEVAELCDGVVGDIPYGEKTPERRQMERRILELIYSRYYAGVPDATATHALDIITHAPTVVDAPVHHLSEVAHHHGELTLALRAGRMAIVVWRTDPNSARTYQLRRLAQDVIPLITGELEASIEHFPFIEQLLERTVGQSRRILDLLDAMPGTVPV